MKRINVEVDDDTYWGLKEWCSQNHTNLSDWLRAQVSKQISMKVRNTLTTSSSDKSDRTLQARISAASDLIQNHRKVQNG